jgi:hypothetical protein
VARDRQADGIQGRRLLIVGYSHFCKTSEMEDPLLTVKLLAHVRDGDERHAFWASIMHYFVIQNPREF